MSNAIDDFINRTQLPIEIKTNLEKLDTELSNLQKKFQALKLNANAVLTKLSSTVSTIFNDHTARTKNIQTGREKAQIEMADQITSQINSVTDLQTQITEIKNKVSFLQQDLSANEQSLKTLLDSCNTTKDENSILYLRDTAYRIQILQRIQPKIETCRTVVSDLNQILCTNISKPVSKKS